MSDRMASSRGPARKPLPENPIIQQTSKALEEFFTTALAELETKMKGVLQPRTGAKPVNWPIQLLTEQMISELSENVRRVLGTGTTAKDHHAARLPARRKPSGRRP